jgi:hypothetical protein
MGRHESCGVRACRYGATDGVFAALLMMEVENTR